MYLHISIMEDKCFFRIAGGLAQDITREYKLSKQVSPYLYVICISISPYLHYGRQVFLWNSWRLGLGYHKKIQIVKNRYPLFES